MLFERLILLLIVKQGLSESLIDGLKVCLSGQGCLQGTYMSGYETDRFEAFLGIPFAEPPVGPLRFKNPIPARPWNNVLAVKTAKPDCIQKNYLLDDPLVSGDENCLYLNVYRPVNRTEKPLPVMFYIYGGGFFCGSMNPDYMDPAYFMDTQEVIIVMANYRLGPFGFLSTGTVEMPGNLGLKDQKLALKWVQLYIAAFGGDPNAVTLFGHSVGASSVEFQMLSKDSMKLFNAAIMGSGNALGPYVATIEEPYKQVLQIVENLDIDDDISNMDQKLLIETLQTIDAYSLVTAGDSLKSWHQFPLFNFRPVIEDPNWPDAFLIERPKTLINSGSFIQVPTLHSLVSNHGEGAVYTLKIWTHQDMRDEFNGDFDEHLWQLMELPLNVTIEKQAIIIDMIVKEYFEGNREVNNSTIHGFTELFSDIAFYYPFWKNIKLNVYNGLHSAPMFLVQFNYNGPRSRAFIYNGGVPINFGVVHMDEVGYLFRSPALYPTDFEKDSVDAKLVREFVRLYVDFAKYNEIKGITPCNNDSFSGPNESGMCDYLEYQNHVGIGYQTNVHNHFNTKRMQFWDDLIGNIIF